MSALDLDAVAAALRADARFSAWQVSDARGRSTQRYDVFGAPEVRRVVETHVIDVRVHVAHDDGTLGESSFVVDKRAAIGAQLDAAFSRARLVKNKRWTLPGPQAAVAVDAVDAHIVEDAGGASDALMAAIARGLPSTSSAVRCCSAEAFCDFRRVHLVNSLGLDRTREETSAFVEYILLAAATNRGATGGDETETYSSMRTRTLAADALAARVDADARSVIDAQRARMPDSGVVDVVLVEQGIDEIYDAFVAHAGGGAAFEGWSKLKPGKAVVDDGPDDVSGDVGDRLSLVSDPTVPGGLASFAFDDTGLSGAKVVVVDDGIFVGRPLEQRYACWLDQAPTSSWGNVVVASGRRTRAELLVPGPRPLLLLERFSQLTPHPTTGSFSGELRLGYAIDAAGRAPPAPLKGGSLTGNVFDAFRRAQFSAERAVRGRLHAPAALRLNAVQFTGADS
jgi:predicted Zn-dependent protease